MMDEVIKEDGLDMKIVMEFYVISVLIVVGLIGNGLSIIVLRKDRERRDVLFLLQARNENQ